MAVLSQKPHVEETSKEKQGRLGYSVMISPNLKLNKNKAVRPALSLELWLS